MSNNSWFSIIEKTLPSTSELEALFDQLWPICRSITGNGMRKSLEILSQKTALTTFETPSGTRAFDWTVPLEWNIEDAYLEDETGRKVIDFKVSNLHVLNYSMPIDCWLTLEELTPHLHTLPELPDAIPYMTSYYEDRWGFCLSENQKNKLRPGKYHAVIKSSKTKGSLTIAHSQLQGTRSKREILLSSYLCHPSLANNELSGPIALTYIKSILEKVSPRHLSYRFIIGPETIGPIVYLKHYGEEMKRQVMAGFILTCLGDPGSFTYKRSRTGNTMSDRLVEQELKFVNKPLRTIDFFPAGSDERQYCSPGFNLPVGSLMRSMWATFTEYHTSLDNKAFISFGALRESIATYVHLCLAIEFNRTYLNTQPFGEPMLGPRGLYPTLGAQRERNERVEKIRWILNQSDGTQDLLAIAAKAQCSILELEPLVKELIQKGLLVDFQPGLSVNLVPETSPSSP